MTLVLNTEKQTDDQVTFDSAYATKNTVSLLNVLPLLPNADRVVEYNLKQMWKSPNGTIRALLDGTVFRSPIVVKVLHLYPNLDKTNYHWRVMHTVMFIKTLEMVVEANSKAELVVTKADGTEERALIHNFETPGILQGLHNLDKSIESFARACFNYALDLKQDLWFSTKDTISKKI